MVKINPVHLKTPKNLKIMILNKKTRYIFTFKKNFRTPKCNVLISQAKLIDLKAYNDLYNKHS